MGTDFSHRQPLWTNEYKNLTANATANTVDGAAATVYAVEVDNSANNAVSYFKMYDDLTPSIGTAVPDVVIRIPASTKMKIPLAGGDGYSFGTGVTIACVTTPGTAGSTDPASAVKATIWTN